MPIYEYVCETCNQEFEHLQRGDEKPACPSCGKKRLSKKFSVPAAHTGGGDPACPARDAGMCNPTGGCGGGGGCGMGGLM